MGRCYEFGVSIDPSSELAMVVAPEGGHCQCPSTGATCRGRFAGCAEIISQPGRVPPNAPEWSLGSGAAAPAPAQVHVAQIASQPAPQPVPPPVVQQPTMQQPVQQPVVTQQFVPAPTLPAKPHATARHESAEAFQSALAAAEDRSVVRNNDTALVEMREAVDVLTHQVAELKNRPAGATIENLAEAVVILRQQAAADADADGMRELVETIAANQHAATALPDQMTALQQSMLDVTESVAEIAERQTELVATASDTTSEFDESMQKLGRAILELRGAQTGALEQLRSAQATTTAAVEALRDELSELAKRQARELHAVRQQFTEVRTRVEEREGADISADELAAQLNKMQSEIARLSPEGAEMISATQLADTINTLRDAGVEDLSAAHLVHALQTDMRTIRDEVQSVKGRVEALIPDVPDHETHAQPV